MSKYLRLDYETASEVELGGNQSVGLYNYAVHPSTRVLMLAYKFPGDVLVSIWFPHEGPMPERLRAGLLDPDQMLTAYNASFERYITQYKLGITIPASRFQDPQASARYLSMPGALDKVGDILGLPFSLKKDKRGEELMKLFSYPQKKSLGRGKGHQLFFYDWNSHPAAWAEFAEYCKQDVVAEEEVARRMEILEAFPLPAFERKLWLFDQDVNDRGMPVDVEFVQKAYKLAMRGKREAREAQDRITGLENSNSPAQLLPWLRARGYKFNTLRKQTVEVVLKDPETQLTPEARAVLTSRKESASTSYTKLSAILRQVSKDGRLRNQFIFMGSARCGRWSGNAVQLHNMARPDDIFEDLKMVNKAREMVYAEDYDGLNTAFFKRDKEGNPLPPMPALLVIRSIIRTVFVAPKQEQEVNITVEIEDDDE